MPGMDTLTLDQSPDTSPGIALPVEQAPAPEPASPTRQSTSSIPGLLALAMGALWVAMLATVEILAPAPAEEPDTLAVAIGLIFEVVLLATIVGLASRRRWGLMASVGGGVILLGASALCSLEGHAAAWLTAQYLAGAVILGTSRMALKRF